MESFFTGVMEWETINRLRREGRVESLSFDWRKDWRGPGQHSTEITLRAGLINYHRDAAIFDLRTWYELQNQNRTFPLNVNSDVFTTHVYRHPEYVAAIRDHNPRSVFDDRGDDR